VSGASKTTRGDDSTLKEEDDLLSDYTSETSFFDDVGSPSMIAAATSLKEEWNYTCYKSEGKVHIFGEWTSKTKASRMIVIGPDWPCVLMTYIVIVVPSVFVYLYIVHDLAEEIIFFLLFGLVIFGLTTVFVADPGLVRKYHHARDRNWTYCDPCESFRPPHTVHCSSCQVCVASYDVRLSSFRVLPSPISLLTSPSSPSLPFSHSTTAHGQVNVSEPVTFSGFVCLFSRSFYLFSITSLSRLSMPSVYNKFCALPPKKCPLCLLPPFLSAKNITLWSSTPCILEASNPRKLGSRGDAKLLRLLK